jgi:hypothetical protein
MRAYTKILDKRLVDIAYEALKFCLDNHRKSFRVREVFKDHHKINDFQKLGYWNIFKRTKEGWEMTDRTIAFLCGDLELPKKVWVFNRKVVEESEEKVRADTVTDRWQKMRLDYTMDYKGRPFCQDTELIPKRF